jgi:hypothetical protein
MFLSMERDGSGIWEMRRYEVISGRRRWLLLLLLMVLMVLVLCLGGLLALVRSMSTVIILDNPESRNRGTISGELGFVCGFTKHVEDTCLVYTPQIYPRGRGPYSPSSNSGHFIQHGSIVF